MTRTSFILGTLAFFFGNAICHAQVREIVASGEYRMGDSDTKVNARRLALESAKRNALEQAGTYVSSLSEVKNFQLTEDQIRTYVAGIVQLVGDPVERTIFDGGTQVVRIEVRARIEPSDVASQIDNLRKDPATTQELRRMQSEIEALRRTVEAMNRDRNKLTAPGAVDEANRQLQETLNRVDARELLAQAWVALGGSAKGVMSVRSSSIEGRTRARRLVEQALAAEPGNALAHVRLGDILIEEREPQRAEAEYRKAIAADGKRADAHLGLGIALRAQGKQAEAIAEYRETLRLNPSYQSAHYNIGNVFRDQGKFPEAIAEYREALRIEPNDVGAHLNIGSALRAQGKLPEAIAEYRAALRIDPANPDTHYNLGNVFRQQGNSSDAIAEYRAALRINPNDAEAHYYIGLVLMEEGNRAESIREFEEFLRLAPSTSANQELIQRARRSIEDLQKK